MFQCGIDNLNMIKLFHIEVAFPRRRSGSRQKSVHTLAQDRVLYQLSRMPGPQAASRVRSKPPSFPVQFSVTVFKKVTTKRQRNSRISFVCIQARDTKRID